jgi:hypothetical protein
MKRTRIVTLTKVRSLDGELLYFTFPVFGRRREAEFVGKERAPPFEGESATFELEKVREPGCPWLRWRVVRRVES